MSRTPYFESWRREALRTNLWVVPTAMSCLTVLLFAATLTVDRVAAGGTLRLPSWIDSGSPDAARQILTSIAAAIITVVGVVFSITIVALTLASTQFGPRMLRNFVRSLGTQVTLGAFVATFLYSILGLVAISGQFVPHLSITVDFLLVVVDLGVLIYFIHHVATSIQMNQVIADIANDLISSIDAAAEVDGRAARHPIVQVGPSEAEASAWLDDHGAPVRAVKSGFLQVVDHHRLIAEASRARALVRLLYLPRHFIVEGRTLALVWPPEAAPDIQRALERAHFVGPYRTRSQDIVLAIDQLVEIAIRALSPAVNDTFTALACIDWLSAGLVKISTMTKPGHVHRDDTGHIRLIEAELPYERLVNGAFDKVRQAGRGMPAVTIRLLEALARIMEFAGDEHQACVLMHQAEMLLRSSEEAIPEPDDRQAVSDRYEKVVAARRSGSQ